MLHLYKVLISYANLISSKYFFQGRRRG